MCFQLRFVLWALKSDVAIFKVSSHLTNWENLIFIAALEPIWKPQIKMVTESSFSF